MWQHGPLCLSHVTSHVNSGRETCSVGILTYYSICSYACVSIARGIFTRLSTTTRVNNIFLYHYNLFTMLGSDNLNRLPNIRTSSGFLKSVSRLLILLVIFISVNNKHQPFLLVFYQLFTFSSSFRREHHVCGGKNYEYTI